MPLWRLQPMVNVVDLVKENMRRHLPAATEPTLAEMAVGPVAGATPD
jgi:hypothetical protein